MNQASFATESHIFFDTVILDERALVAAANSRGIPDRALSRSITSMALRENSLDTLNRSGDVADLNLKCKLNP